MTMAHPSQMKRFPSSGIDALVVGGGIAGLSFAIEAYRKGHSVRILERRPYFEDFGDMIGVHHPALRMFQNWPGFLDRAQKDSYTHTTYFKKFDGTLVGVRVFGKPGQYSMFLNRAQLHRTLVEYVQELGIPIEHEAHVVAYVEDDDRKGGVRLKDGRTLFADVVVAADGAGSKSFDLVLGRSEEVLSSGFAIYRITFDHAEAFKNPIIAKEFNTPDSRITTYFGPDTHVVVGKTEKQISWVLTHRDDGTATESWKATASSDMALQNVEGWLPALRELINATPNHTCTDWKLVWRNPQTKWASPHGRVVQIGDAAHTYLPTSASGATMAIEDACTLVTCLQISGKADVGLATKVYNHLRFERATCTQKMGYKNREKLHKTNWDAIGTNEAELDKLTHMMPSWVSQHDPEQYAIDNYSACASHLLKGTPFKHTNSVPGHNFRLWTVKELLEASDKGTPVADDGEWN